MQWRAPSGERLAVVAAMAAAVVGLAYRLHEFGRYGFWNDEAWVALSTRIHDPGQLRLAVACSPALWTVLLRPLALLPHPEVALRLLPLACSLATLGLAWHLGRRLGGHALGGALAVLLVALDPTSIRYAKELKQYSAEALLLLTTLALAVDAVGDGRRVGPLAALLVVGLGVSNAQLFVSPAVLGGVLLGAIVGRDRRLAWRIVTTGAIVGAASVAFYVVVVGPWRSESLQAFWTGDYLPAHDVRATATRAWAGLQAVLAPGLGPQAGWIALLAMGVMLVVPAGRMVATVLVLLVVELVVLARLALVPFGVPRLALFWTTAVLVVVGAALARLVVAVGWRWRLWPVAALVLAAGLASILRGRPWMQMASVASPEDVGPLIRRMERHRRADDVILVYERTLYTYAYYAARTPVLVPFPPSSVGFMPLFDDPALGVVTPETVRGALDRAPPGARRVWFVGSRFRSGDASAIRGVLASRGTIERERRRPGGLLLRATLRSVARQAETSGRVRARSVRATSG